MRGMPPPQTEQRKNPVSRHRAAARPDSGLPSNVPLGARMYRALVFALLVGEGRAIRHQSAGFHIFIPRED